MAEGRSDRNRSPTLAELMARLGAFRDVRDWQEFHTPRNLATALSVEAAEVLEHFIWGDEGQGDSSEVAEELADVAIFLLYLADALRVDLAAEVTAKIERNEARFPVEVVRGKPRIPPALPTD